MGERFFTVDKHPDQWAPGVCHAVVTTAPWQRQRFSVGSVQVAGRKAWGAGDPVWSNEVVYYNTLEATLPAILERIVVHHTDNVDAIQANERKQQQSKGYAALGYHFFIDQSANVYEGRPIEIMGSHAGAGTTSGPLNDPDWGSIGIVMQGDYHNADNWFFQSNSTAPQAQLDMLESLITALRNAYGIDQLLMHREVTRSGTPTVCPGDHMAGHVTAMRTRLGMRGP
jgi:hypothetical protein